MHRPAPNRPWRIAAFGLKAPYAPHSRRVNFTGNASSIP